MFCIDREPMTPLRRRFIDDLRLGDESPRKVLAWRRCTKENALGGTELFDRLGQSDLDRESLMNVSRRLLSHAKPSTQLLSDPSLR